MASAPDGESGQHHRGEPHELESREHRDPGESELDRLQRNERAHEMREESVEMERVVHQDVLDDPLEAALVANERKKARAEDGERQERKRALPPTRSGCEQEPERKKDQDVLDDEGDAEKAHRRAVSSEAGRFLSLERQTGGESEQNRQVLELGMEAGNEKRYRVEKKERADRERVSAREQTRDADVHQGKKQGQQAVEAHQTLRVRELSLNVPGAGADVGPDRTVRVPVGLGVDVLSVADEIGEQRPGLEIEVVAQAGKHPLRDRGRDGEEGEESDAESHAASRRMVASVLVESKPCFHRDRFDPSPPRSGKTTIAMGFAA